MAWDFSKLNFFSRLDARARVFFLLASVVGVILVVYLGVRLFWGGDDTTGSSRVARTPDLQTVPGSPLSPAFQQAVQQANIQRQQQATATGGTAAPSIMYMPNQPQATQADCNIICSDQLATVNTSLDNMVRQGLITPDLATSLEQLAASNVPVSEYANQLAQLVKNGQLTPEQARELLEQYKKQHANARLQAAAQNMDRLIKDGTLPLDAANQLLTAQKNGVNASDYARQLQDLVAQGKISPQTAQQLLAQFIKECSDEAARENLAFVNQMARNGEITNDVAKQMADLTTRNATVNDYENALKKAVDDGKLTPAATVKLLTMYSRQKTKCGSSLDAVKDLIKQAEAAAYQELKDLVSAGKITPDTAKQIADMIQQNVSFADFQTAINRLVTENKLTPEIAQLKLADYQKVKDLRNLADELTRLQGNNASSGEYAEALKRAVASGALTPEEAARLMQQYQAMLAGPGMATPADIAVTPDTADFARLQQAVQQSTPTTGPAATAQDFEVAQAQAGAETSQDRQARIQALMTAMSGQAQSLIASWQPPKMEHKAGSPQTTVRVNADGTTTTTTTGATTTTVTQTTAASDVPPLIKSGTILFAVLDTAVNSDYPTSPVLATIVAGEFKGAKLLGQLVTAKNPAGQLDRIGLNFTLMNMDQWTKSKSVKAFAIDPDTARVVMASDVDRHWAKRFGAIMATAFLEGYAQSITNAGTATTGIFGTSTTHPALSGANKIWVGLGQVGETLGEAVQPWINIPPTVRVDSGVGLGILFMSDVT